MTHIPALNTTPSPSCVPSPMLDPTSAGSYLGGQENPISVLTLADWRTKGIGPDYVKVGRLIRYRQVDLDTWIETHVKRGA